MHASLPPEHPTLTMSLKSTEIKMATVLVKRSVLNTNLNFITMIPIMGIKLYGVIYFSSIVNIYKAKAIADLHNVVIRLQLHCTRPHFVFVLFFKF